MVQVPLLRLECGCNSYEWGKVGKSSAAARFAAATNFKIQDDKPYAELWMGTHPSLPSKDLKTGRSLLELAEDNHSLIGAEVTEHYGNKLPFLFKVLSITKALSIQAHPNKKLAEQLHKKDSKNYPDDNHKPEMAIAITPFDGLCGFRPLPEISHFLKNLKPLRDIVGETAADEFISAVKGQETTTDDTKAEKNKKALQKVFSTLMKKVTNDESALKSSTAELVGLAKSEGSSFAAGGAGPTSGKELADLVIRLDSQFPHDAGLLVFFFLNYVKLDVGEAMFLKADDIHAYLSGDIMECMASSDNVVRAGFTPKFKDVSTLTDMLTYSYAPISEQKMDPADYPYVKLDQKAYSAGSSAICYDPPIEEFSVVKTDLKVKGGKATFESIDGPSIIICTSGSGTIGVGSTVEEMKTGYVYFVGATAELVLESAGEEEFVTFKAFCELQGKESAKKNGKI